MSEKKSEKKPFIAYELSESKACNFAGHILIRPHFIGRDGKLRTLPPFHDGYAAPRRRSSVSYIGDTLNYLRSDRADVRVAIGVLGEKGLVAIEVAKLCDAEHGVKERRRTAPRLERIGAFALAAPDAEVHPAGKRKTSLGYGLYREDHVAGSGPIARFVELAVTEQENTEYSINAIVRAGPYWQPSPTQPGRVDTFVALRGIETVVPAEEAAVALAT
jgi:hypothetical protein